MESRKCANCTGNIDLNDICPYCGYDNKNNVLIDFVYPDELQNTDEKEISGNINNIHELKKQKIINVCLKIILAVILLINTYFLYNRLYDTLKINGHNNLGIADGKLLTMDDTIKKFFELLEEQEDFTVFNSSNTKWYEILKNGSINSSDAELSLAFPNNEDDIITVNYISLSTSCTKDKAEETITRLYRLMVNIFGEPKLSDENNIYKWDYSDKEIVMKVIYGISDDEQRIYVYINIWQ